VDDDEFSVMPSMHQPMHSHLQDSVQPHLQEEERQRALLLCQLANSIWGPEGWSFVMKNFSTVKIEVNDTMFQVIFEAPMSDFGQLNE